MRARCVCVCVRDNEQSVFSAAGQLVLVTSGPHKASYAAWFQAHNQEYSRGGQLHCGEQEKGGGGRSAIKQN